MSVANSTTARLLAGIAALVLAAGAAACGSDDDGSDAAPQASKGSTVTEPAESTPKPAGQAEPTPKSDRRNTSAGDGYKGGDGEKVSSGSGASSGFVQRPKTVSDGTEEKQALDTVARMYESLADADAEGLCATMSKAAKEQIANGQVPGDDSGANPTCEESFSRSLGAASQGGELRALSRKIKLGKVELDGDKGTVTISFAGTSGKVRLVKEDGKWLVSSPGSASSGGG